MDRKDRIAITTGFTASGSIVLGQTFGYWVQFAVVAVFCAGGLVSICHAKRKQQRDHDTAPPGTDS